MRTVEAPVLIVGGGPVGLTASVLLARLGVPSLLVERRPGVTEHPRSRLINTRTVEVLRSCGLESAFEEISLPKAWRQQVIYTTSLAGKELGRVKTDAWAGDATLSPVLPLISSQDKMEPLLRECAEGLQGAELRFSTELVGLEQDETGVTATLLDHQAQRKEQLRTSYLIGADGASSFVRRQLGLEWVGQTGIASLRTVYCLADLSPWIADRPAALYWVSSKGVTGVLAPLDGKERWVCQIGYNPEHESTGDFTPERCADWIRAAVGDPSVPLNILSINPWTLSSVIAERLRQGRVFLVGDAAHQLPPTGGFGMNTGMQAMHNLAWKLAGVIQGWAAPRLLDTYELERVPVARYNSEKSLENFLMVARVNAAVMAQGAGEAEVDDQTRAAIRGARRYGNFIGMDLGFAYAQGAVVPDGSAPPKVADDVSRYIPTARPGHRAPHVPLVKDGREISSLDLFDFRFTLLTGANGSAWIEAGGKLAQARGLPLSAHRVGPGAELSDPGGRFLDAYGLSPQGAVLVRPDGHVGWRSRQAWTEPGPTLERALARLLGR